MGTDTVLVENCGSIYTITLNRPRVKNAFDIEMLASLAAVLERVARAQEVRVVVLAGAGGNFSAGADISLLARQRSSDEYLREVMQVVSHAVRTMREMPLPIIAAVSGAAYGGGMNLALATDFVIATHEARLSEVFVNLGVVLDTGGTYFLPRIVGMAKAKALALLGEEIDGRTAAAMGLIYRSVAAADLDAEVAALAAKLLQKPPSALALIKRGLESSLDMTLEQALAWEAAYQAIMLQTGAVKEVAARFLQSRGKRSPESLTADETLKGGC